MRLLDYAVNVYSQNGEDGILPKILELLPVTDKWCVEFGAWDGKYFSNTCNLIERYGYSAMLIEPRRTRFAELLKNYAGNRNVIALNRFVGFTPDNNLDHILSSTAIPKDFDLLTIDIEGNDYHAWDAISSYTPKVVHIPHNPTIPNEVDFVQPADPSVSQGQSLLALVRLARRKDYELICVNHNTAFFVRSMYFSLFGISNNDPRVLREDLSGITYLFCGYDGTLFVRGRELVQSHRGIRIQKRLRQLPKIFRSNPYNWGNFTSVLYKIYFRIARMLGRG